MDIALTVHFHTCAGVPPLYHGSMEGPKAIELECMKAGVHVFVEKPVSLLPPEQFSSYVQAVEGMQREKALVLSVGYMFRYHPAIEKNEISPEGI